MEQQSLLETVQPNKPENHKYLLQINRIKMQDYVQRGLIVADRYLSDECENDIQSKNTDYLFVSDGYIPKLNEQQILLELIFTEKEKEQLIQVDELCYFDFPLPISRIKKIYTHSKEISKAIHVDMKVMEKGFLPLSIFDEYRKRKNIVFQETIYKQLENRDEEPRNYGEKINHFNKRMGMFAYVKNVNIYYANKTNIISNYSTNYFSMLSFLLKDKLVDDEFRELSILNKHPKFKELLFSKKQIDEEFMKEIADDIEDIKLKEIFNGFFKPNKTSDTLQKLLEAQYYLYYYIGLIYYFRFKNSNKKDNIKQAIDTIIPQELAETVLALLGIYFGYESLRPNDEIDLEDEYFRELFGTCNIKFTLESKLDYITIESIYRYSFYDEKEGHEFEYLTYPKKPKPMKLPNKKKFTQWYKVVDKKEYFDAEYICIKKRDKKEYIETTLQKYGDEIVFSKHYLSVFVSKYFQSLISYDKNGEPCKPYCKVDEFKEVILQKTEKIDELLEAFSMDKK